MNGNLVSKAKLLLYKSSLIINDGYLIIISLCSILNGKILIGTIPILYLYNNKQTVMLHQVTYKNNYIRR